MAGRHVELREIDYAEVLRERRGGESATWDKVIANCLEGDGGFTVNDDFLRALQEIAADPEQLGDLVSTLDARVPDERGGIETKTAALLRMLRGIVEGVSKNEPERLDPVLRNMAAAVGQLSPDMLMGLISRASGASTDGDDETPGLVTAVVSRMSEARSRGSSPAT